MHDRWVGFYDFILQIKPFLPSMFVWLKMYFKTKLISLFLHYDQCWGAGTGS